MLHWSAAPGCVVGSRACAGAGVCDVHKDRLRIVPALDKVLVVCSSRIAWEGTSLGVLGVRGDRLHKRPIGSAHHIQTAL